MSLSHLLFIPVYNCEQQIPRVINKILESSIYEKFDEILIIDNNSVDNTADIVLKKINSENCKKFKFFQNKKNYNLGGTHKTGFNYAIENKFDYVTILHGDDQGNINDLEKVFKDEKFKNYDCCLGSRFSKNSILINYPKFRIYSNYMINFVASIVTFKFLTDLGSGLNMFRVDYLKNKFYLDFPNDLTFNYCLIFYIWSSKAKYFYFPILWREDDQISNVKLFSHGLKWLEIVIKYIFKRKKLFINNDLRNQEYTFK